MEYNYCSINYSLISNQFLKEHNNIHFMMFRNKFLFQLAICSTFFIQFPMKIFLHFFHFSIAFLYDFFGVIDFFNVNAMLHVNRGTLDKRHFRSFSIIAIFTVNPMLYVNRRTLNYRRTICRWRILVIRVSMIFFEVMDCFNLKSYITNFFFNHSKNSQRETKIFHAIF